MRIKSFAIKYTPRGTPHPPTPVNCAFARDFIRIARKPNARAGWRVIDSNEIVGHHHIFHRFFRNSKKICFPLIPHTYIVFTDLREKFSFSFLYVE